MELKKNPKSELKKNSTLYFTMGLTITLLLVFIALETKIQHYSAKYISCPTEEDFFVENIQDELLEELPPITFQELPPPPPAISFIEEEITVIECPLPIDTTTGIISCSGLGIVDEIDFKEVPIDEEIPISVVEDAPIFPGCEDVDDKRTCFQEMMHEHIRKNFRYPEIAKEMGLQGRVSIVFIVQKDGSIDNVRMRGPHETLEKEAARIISKLPKMTPGKQRGQAVKVPFSIPITFKLQ